MQIIKTMLPIIAFIAWCLWGINWRRAWPVLAAGGWAPFVLIGLTAGLVWAFVFPSQPPIPNYLWHVGIAGLLICLALACGWLQGRMGWTPPEFSFEPPPPSHDHGHGHDHH
jgi:hypothetical protein